LSILLHYFIRGIFTLLRLQCSNIVLEHAAWSLKGARIA